MNYNWKNIPVNVYSIHIWSAQLPNILGLYNEISNLRKITQEEKGHVVEKQGKKRNNGER